MNNGTQSLTGQLLTDLFLACALAGQIACPEARGNEQILKTFSYADTNTNPWGLVQSADGALYGLFSGGVFRLNSDGTGFKILHRFGTIPDDAAYPIALVLGADGALYGTSEEGGGYFGGTVFKLNTDGASYKLLHSFLGGSLPQAGLVYGTDGELYGTTFLGGASNSGTVFRLDPNSTNFLVLHNFGQSTNDGTWPDAALMQGTDGALYGTTSSGGTNETALGGGTLFKLNRDGTGFIVLHCFPESTNDGTGPNTALVQGTDGYLYGTTVGGGSAYGGIVFRLNPDGTDYMVLHDFQGNNRRWTTPAPALVQGGDGNVYGVTIDLAWPVTGAVFRLKPDGTVYTLVHVFGSFVGDGIDPDWLLRGTAGAFYGATWYGGSGAGAQGTVFRLTTSPSPPFVVSIVPLVGGGFTLSFDGVIGTTYRLDTSTNLSDWTTLGTVFNESGPVQFLDGNETKAPHRFYRAVLLP